MFVLVHQKGPDGLPMLRLLAESGPLQGKMFKLKTPLSSVGSASENEVHIPLPYVADVHFTIEVDGDQNIVLRDRGSEGGTLVNDQAADAVYLQHGDRIAFGRTATASSGSSQPAASPFASPEGGGVQEIFLAEQTVNPMIDDVRTVLGSPMARWGTQQPPGAKQNLRPPPGAPGVAVMSSEGADWRQRKLEVLLAVGKALSRPEAISTKVDRVLELLHETMDIDRAAILVLADEHEAGGEKADPLAQGESSGSPQSGSQQLQVGEWKFSWTAYRDSQGPTSQLPLSSTIIQKVLTDEVAVMTQDAQAEDWLDGARSVFGQAIRTCICTPLKTSSGILGVLYADSARTSYPFSKDDLEFFTAFSNQAAVAMENTRLLQVALQKERMEQDLRVARRIQLWLFPREIPSLQGYDLAGDSRAMEEVGGDYFDFIPLNERLLALVVGDVSGHGISSALVMTMTRSILRGSLLPHISPAEVLQRVNQFVSEDMITRMFVTMMLAVVDLHSGRFLFSNAGHNPPLLYRAHLQQIQPVATSRGGPLGMSRWARLQPRYENHQEILYPGDILCLYTDGFPEAMNAAGEEMELQPLQDVIAYHANSPAPAILEQAFAHLHHFMAGAPSNDDTTAIILKRSPVAPA